MMLTLKDTYFGLLSIAEQCDTMAARHHHGTALLPQGISAAALRDLACAVGDGAKALSKATLEAIAPDCLHANANDSASRE